MHSITKIVVFILTLTLSAFAWSEEPNIHTFEDALKNLYVCRDNLYEDETVKNSVYNEDIEKCDEAIDLVTNEAKRKYPKEIVKLFVNAMASAAADYIVYYDEPYKKILLLEHCQKVCRGLDRP